jgi:hypothetical protein
MVLLRDLRPGVDDTIIRTLFLETFCMGRPAPFELPPTYVQLCLGWYLGPGSHEAAVVEHHGEVVGYALVCSDPAAHHRWVQRATATFVTRAAPRCLRREATSLRGFARARLRDLRAVRASTVQPPMPVHAHLNIVSSQRSGSAAVLLRQHIDHRARLAGAQGWFAEVNAPVGRRLQALERVVGPVTDRRPNHTLTWMTGEAVERLTVVRHLV